jgi:hypothetical protein
MVSRIVVGKSRVVERALRYKLSDRLMNHIRVEASLCESVT